MTLLSSFNISTSGLSAQSRALSGISNNLANASTTAYKGTTSNFEDLVTNYSSSDTGSGTGVTESTRYNNGSQGTISSADSTTYLAIDGSGYFAVRAVTTNADGSLTFGSEVYYTRSGDFSLNSSGYLVNGEGYVLCGWTVDPTTGTVNDANGEADLVPVQISTVSNEAVASSTITYSGNLSSSAADGATSADKTTSIYDSLGASHDVSYSWTKTGTNTWELTVTAANGAYDNITGLTGDYSATIQVTFNTDGSISTVDDSGTGYTVSGNTISFDLTYEGATTQSISCDLSNVTQYSASTTTSGETMTQNGVPAGSYSAIEIDSSGNISVDYSNGVSKTYYELAIATFLAENNLQAVSGNAYRATQASGTATYSAAGTSGAGKISASSLESSNVDLATEFTNLIKTQQVYSANAKALTTADSMMQTLIQLQG